MLLKDGQQFSIGAVTDSVHGYGQPSPIRLGHSLGDLIERGQGHAAVLCVLVGRQHPGRAGSLAAVGEKLDVSHTEAVVAETSAQAKGDGLIQALTRDAHPQPKRKLAVFSKALIDMKGWWSVGTTHDAVIVHTRQAQAMKCSKIVSHCLDEFVLRRRGDDVLHPADG
jgi:hypothetical protein